MADNYCTVHFKNAEPLKVRITHGMSIAMDNNQLTISAEASEKQFAIDDVRAVIYNDHSGIDGGSADIRIPEIRISGHSISVKAPDHNERTLHVYNANGMQIISKGFRGESIIDVSGLGKGVYFISIDDSNAIRIMIK